MRLDWLAISAFALLTGVMGVDNLVAPSVTSTVATEDTARSCVGGLTNDDYWNVSTAVFVGRAVEQTFVSTSDHWTETATTFQVEEQWKGDYQPRLAVRTCGGRGMLCSNTYTFTVGERYLVFASDDPLRTSSCTLTKKGAEAGPVIEWLRQRGH